MQEHEAAATRSIHHAFAAPPALYGPHAYMACWFLDPPGMLVQFVEPAKGTLEQASWLVNEAFEALDEAYPESDDLVFVFDMYHMVGRSAAARSVMLNAAKVLYRRFSHVFVVAPADYPPMYLQAFHASLAVVRLLGLPVSVVSSSAEVIARHGLRAVR